MDMSIQIMSNYEVVGMQRSGYEDTSNFSGFIWQIANLFSHETDFSGNIKSMLQMFL